MKNQSLSNNIKLDLNNQDDKHSLLIDLKCISGVQASFLCINKVCQKSGFICDRKQCNCRKQHINCIRADVQSVISAIQSKGLTLKSFQQRVNSVFDNAIDKLSVLRDQILDKFKQTFQLRTLSKTQNKFLNSFKSQKYKQINGKQVSQIYSQMYEQTQSSKPLIKAGEQLTKIQQTINKQIQKFHLSTQRIIFNLHKQFSLDENLDKFSKIKNIKFIKSQILKSIQDQTKLMQLFQSPYYFETNLLYKASQNNFDAKVFHKNCDDILGLLILIQTSYGKIIGAYTPLAFMSNKKQEYMQDPQGKSFLFSLTNGDKLRLNSKVSAIFYENGDDYALRFGTGSDLRISNYANTNAQSYCAIPSAYVSQNYGSSNEQTYMRFTGSKSIYFGIKQWQVWQLKF